MENIKQYRITTTTLGLNTENGNDLTIPDAVLCKEDLKAIEKELGPISHGQTAGATPKFFKPW